MTYEDVTNVDSVGIITAQKDIHVGAGISAVGIITGQFLMASGGSDDNKQNVKIGWMNSENLTTGSYNVLIGRRAGEGVDTATSLVLIGANAGQALTNQNSSVVIGASAGSNLTGDGNVIIGRNTAQQSTSADSNVIIGTFAGIDNQGSENTIIGYYSGRGNSGVTDGTRNTFVGTKAGFKIRGGDDNTSLGRNSLVELLGGNKNVAIGQQAGDALVSGNNNIIIGYQADASTTTTSNEITLGDANIKHLRIPGIGVSFNNTGGTQLGIITATGADINGDIDVDGHTNLDNVSVAGVSTFTGASTFNQDTTTVKLKVNSTNAQIDLTSGQNSFTRYGAINHYHNNSTSTIHNQIKLAPRNGSTGRIMFSNLISGTLTERLRIDGTDGIQAIAHITPMSDNLYALGGTSTRWSSVSATTFIGNGDFVELDVDGHTNLDNVSVAGVSTFSGIVAAGIGSTAITLGNSHKITLGSAHELELHHDGSNSYIKQRFFAYPSRLKIISENSGIDIMSGSGGNSHGGYENAISCENNGKVKIYHAGVGPALETNGDGVTVPASIWLGAYLKHNSDLDTKFGFPALDTISFDTNGSERLRIDSNGKLLKGHTADVGQIRTQFNHCLLYTSPSPRDRG